MFEYGDDIFAEVDDDWLNDCKHNRFGERKPWCGGEFEIIIWVGEEEPDSGDIDGSTHSKGRLRVTQAIFILSLQRNFF